MTFRPDLSLILPWFLIPDPGREQDGGWRLESAITRSQHWFAYQRQRRGFGDTCRRRSAQKELGDAWPLRRHLGCAVAAAAAAHLRCRGCGRWQTPGTSTDAVCVLNEPVVTRIRNQPSFASQSTLWPLTSA